MSRGGQVRVLVESRQVPVRVLEFQRPVFSASGLLMGTETSRGLVYATSLDDSHRKAIEEGKRLSRNLGLDLKVVDRKNLNPLRRLFSGISSVDPKPSLVLATGSIEGTSAPPT
jgi:hypothetical protein